MSGKLFRRTRKIQVAAVCAGVRSKVYHPVRSANDIQVVLDDYYSIAAVDQGVE